MKSNVTLITLTVADIAKATRFYENLGFAKSKSESQEKVSFFRAGGIVLSLWDRKEQIQDANAGTLWDGNGGIVVAQNVASAAEVDAVLAKAKAAGARILKPGTKTFWGGYNGYFADPDGHLWEIAHNPHWQLDKDGCVELPE
ncbi:MAG TPA: VOC family protein [Candidatus Binatia bacterium]|nr:VOC family protein [Candidatus Binatia bacterium]